MLVARFSGYCIALNVDCLDSSRVNSGPCALPASANPKQRMEHINMMYARTVLVRAALLEHSIKHGGAGHIGCTNMVNKNTAPHNCISAHASHNSIAYMYAHVDCYRTHPGGMMVVVMITMTVTKWTMMVMMLTIMMVTMSHDSSRG